VSAIYAKLRQDALEGQLEDIEKFKPTPVEERALSRLPGQRRRLRFLARAFERQVEDGKPIGRIEIPDIKAKYVVVNGVEPSSLREGPGHYPDTPLPGGKGTVALAGHRTTYGAPFRKLNELERGDEIIMDMPYARFVYAVERNRIVDPDATWVLKSVGYDRLVLTACHPLYSAKQRIVTFARFKRAIPKGLSQLG
jgi:sortase A